MVGTPLEGILLAQPFKRPLACHILSMYYCNVWVWQTPPNAAVGGNIVDIMTYLDAATVNHIIHAYNQNMYLFPSSSNVGLRS